MGKSPLLRFWDWRQNRVIKAAGTIVMKLAVSKRIYKVDNKVNLGALTQPSGLLVVEPIAQRVFIK